MLRESQNSDVDGDRNSIVLNPMGEGPSRRSIAGSRQQDIGSKLDSTGASFKTHTDVTIEKWILDNSVTEEDLKEFNEDETYKLGENDGLIKFTVDIDVDGQKQSRTVFFVQDWTKLWSALVSKKKTYMRAYIPLVYCYQEYFYSKRILSVTIFLTVWEVIVNVICRIMDSSISLVSMYGFICALFVIAWGGTIIKGNVRAATPREVQDHVHPEAMTSLNAHINQKISSVNSGLPQNSVDEKPRNSRAVRDTEWRMNMDDAKSSGTSVTSNTTASVLFSSFAEPSTWYWSEEGTSSLRIKQYTKIEELATMYLRFFGSSEAFHPKPITVILTLAFTVITFAVVMYTYTLMWKYEIENKFCQENTLSSNISCVRFLLSLGNSTTSVLGVLSFLTIVSLFSTLLYGCDLACALTKHWEQRFQGLRQVVKAEEEAEAGPEEGVSKLTTIQQLSLALERDAVERYLFLHQMFDRSTTIWGTLLAVIMVGCVGLGIFAYVELVYYYTIDGYVNEGSVIVICICVIMAVFVVGCMMLANSAIDRINMAFKYTGINDFSIIGGRTAWVDFVAASPVYWYIFGFAITREWLFGFVGGLLATIGATVLFALVGVEG
jgi:hypothetical protein